MLSSDVSNFLRPTSSHPLIQNSETSSQNADYISNRTLDKLKLGFLKNRKIQGKSNGQRPDKLTRVMLDTKLEPFQTIYKADFGKEEISRRKEGRDREGEGEGGREEGGEDEERRRERRGRGNVGKEEERKRGVGMEVEGRRKVCEEGGKEGDLQEEYKNFCGQSFNSEKKQNFLNSMDKRCLSGSKKEWMKDSNAEIVDRNSGDSNKAQEFIKKKENYRNTTPIQNNIPDLFTMIKSKKVIKTKNQASYSDKVSDLKINEPNFSNKNETKSNKFSSKNEPDIALSNRNEEKEDEAGSSSKKCGWLSVEEEQLQDVLNSDVFRELGVDPLTLIEENPDYFSHLFSLCACVRCICGFCKCKYSESKTGSLKISPKNLKSNYQTEFYKKNFQNLVSPLTNHIYSTHDKEIPRIGLDYRTRHKLDFKNLEGASTGGNRRRKKNSYIKNSDPFLSLSAYQSSFVDWKTYASNIVKRPNSKSVLSELPFFGKTTYKDDFLKFERDPGHANFVKSCHEKRINQINPSNTIPLFSETSNNFSFKPYRVGPPVMKTIIKRPSNLDILELTPHKGHYSTVFSHDYVQKNDIICPAKKTIDLKILKGTIREKMENMDREYSRTKRTNSNHQKNQ